MTRLVRYFFIFALAFGGVFLFLMAASSTASSVFEQYFPALLVINIFITSILFVVVIGISSKVILSLRRGQFGALLTAKLGVTIALIAILPSLLIYGLSAAFINKSIESWFDVRVEKALDSSVTLSRGILAKLQKNAEDSAHRMAIDLSQTSPSLMINELMRVMEKTPFTDALVVTGNGTAVAAAGSKLNILVPDMPTQFQLQVVKTSGVYNFLEGDTFEANRGGYKIKVIVPIPAYNESNFSNSDPFLSSSLFSQQQKTNKQLYLQTMMSVPESIGGNIDRLMSGYRDYQELFLSRNSLKIIYGITLTLTLLFAIFTAIVVALSFARKAAEPLMQLAQGTKKISQGSFDPIKEFSGDDEINVLTQSFNGMTIQLKEATQNLEQQKQKAQRAQAYLERVLKNISSGVIVLDEEDRVISINEAAHSILGTTSLISGKKFNDCEPVLSSAMQKMQTLHADEKGNFNFEFELTQGNKSLALYLRVSPIMLAEQLGLILVFDDLTKLIEAQRALAWGEVAKRLAHEIKNPLTPIRLAAERLEMKLEGRLEKTADLDFLHRTTATIVDQVDALKQMVNDFRSYAKLPTARLKRVSLNDIIYNHADLYNIAGLTLTLDLSENLPDVMADVAQIRQVIHNLLNNSLDSTNGLKERVIKLTTTAAYSETDPKKVVGVLFVVEDNGSGFEDEILKTAFEPYVTTKETGTGLGLSMVKKIMDEHNARIVLQNKTDIHTGVNIGAKVCMKFLTSSTSPLEEDKNNLL